MEESLKAHRRRKEARPGEIIESALHLFAEKGYAATKLAEVAVAAGVSKGTIYLYFPTKEDLFRAVVRQRILPNLQAVAALAGQADLPAADMLRAIAGRFLGVLESDLTAIPKIVMSESGNFPSIARFYAEEVVDGALALLRGVLARGVARGEFHPLDIEATVPVFVAPMLLMMLWKHSLGRHTEIGLKPERIMAAHLDTFLRGLAAGGQT